MTDQPKTSLRVSFEPDNGVITLMSDADQVFEHFKHILTNALADNGFFVNWDDGNSGDCDISIKLVKLDQGQNSLRSFLQYVPLMSPVVCLFPVAFEAEVTIAHNNSKPQDFHYIETHRNAIADSVTMLTVCSNRIASRICEDICSVCK